MFIHFEIPKKIKYSNNNKNEENTLNISGVNILLIFQIKNTSVKNVSVLLLFQQHLMNFMNLYFSIF